MTAARRRGTLVGRLATIATAVVVAASGLTAVAVAEQPAAALTAPEILRSFDPSDIISDAVMFNPATMTAGQIQAFLNSKVSSCRSGYTCLKDYRQDTYTKAADPMCNTYTGAKNETAATIISRVSTACGVNPQVLLVTLQKEQSLIMDDWPTARQYRSATGYGCPDTAPCDSLYYGFFNQVYKAAWAFKRYTSPKGTEGPGWTRYNWFPVGTVSGVLYNPDAACGARPITIKNKATAVLYYFTPYLPNAASLAAGFGTGDSCSAYGNRNFFLYFTSWFGSTHYVVTGAIATYWNSKGGSKSALGEPVENAVGGSGGTVQRFAGGTVYSSGSGTVAVTGAMQTEYVQSGGPGGALGWPKAEPVRRSDNGGGAVQAFSAGAVYSSRWGTFAVTGGVLDRYNRVAAQAGRMGWPTADAVTSSAAGGGAWQAFQGGRIAATATASATVTGVPLTWWLRRGGEGGSLGWPTGEAGTVRSSGRTGTVQSFTTGDIVVLGSRVLTVTGDIARNWRAHDGATGGLGWPTSLATRSDRNGSGWSQRFEKGAVFTSAASGPHALAGAELTLYDRRGGTEGSLGWPGTRVTSKAGIGGAITPFTNGNIYRSRAGTAAVLGDILRLYVKNGGPGGSLGWPTADARQERGVLTQRFERGKITWTAGGGAKAGRL